MFFVFLWGINCIIVIWRMWNWIWIWVKNVVNLNIIVLIVLFWLFKLLLFMCMIRYVGWCLLMMVKMVCKWCGFVIVFLLMLKKFICGRFVILKILVEVWLLINVLKCFIWELLIYNIVILFLGYVICCLFLNRVNNDW